MLSYKYCLSNILWEDLALSKETMQNKLTELILGDPRT